jgi:poly(A) polymerase
MIKTFIHRLLGRGAAAAEPAAAATPLGQRVEIPASQHGIDPRLLDDNAVRVVRGLRDAGHEAYIVGGAVRDLLVGRRPKDFDVATDATPEQVKACFRRAFIIGRRFRIVHVVFGRGREHEVIEVSTFRALLAAEGAEQVQGNEKTSKAALAGKTHVVDASGRILRDNVWGPQVEDAARRDFTVNAMYYEPLTQTLVDYHGGLGDVRQRVLRMIGDPATRYREDPVRIIRAVRFAAKLGFALEPGTQVPVKAMAPLLANVPASRLFDEMIKLLQTGHALSSLDELQRQGLGRGLFPILDAALPDGQPGGAGEAFVRLALRNTDERVADGRAVAPSFLLACLLWFEVQTRWRRGREAGENPFPALQQAIDAVFEARVGDISGRGKLAADMREIWMMQPRFERRSASSAANLVEQPRFRAAYDFLRLRADVGEVPTELADWWEDFSLGSDEDREALLRDLRPPGGRRGASGASGASGARGGRGGVSRAEPAQAGHSTLGASGDESGDGADDGDEPGDMADSSDEQSTEQAPRKRRRRRRRSRSSGAEASDSGGHADQQP